MHFLNYILTTPKPPVSRSAVLPCGEEMGGNSCWHFTTFSRFTCLCFKLLLLSFVHVNRTIPQQLYIKMAILLLTNVNGSLEGATFSYYKKSNLQNLQGSRFADNWKQVLYIHWNFMIQLLTHYLPKLLKFIFLFINETYKFE